MANVFHFGAAGNGQTDDTDALQHALEEGDGVLHLNKGTYRITRPLVIDLTKQGYGGLRGEAGTSRIVMEGPGPALRILGDHRGTASPGTVEKHTWEKERFPTVTDVEILGKHPEAVGIELRKTMQATVSRVLIRNCRQGIHLVERNRNFVLSDSHLYKNAHYGLFLDRCNLHQMIVHGNHISYNKKGGIRSFNGDVHNFQITGNDIEYNNHPGKDRPGDAGAEIWFEAPEGKISEVTIAGNTIQATVQPGGANIRIYGSEGEGPPGARLIAISGNVIGSQTRGIDIQRAMRVAVSGNTIYDSDELSLSLRHCMGVAVGSNTFIWRGQEDDPPRDGLLFEDCENGVLTGLATQRLCSGTADRGAGVTFRRCRDMALSDCQILDPLVRGVELEDCLRCRVSNNTILDRRKEPTMCQAIRVRGDSRHNLLQNNLLGGAKEKNIEAVEGSAIEQGNVEIEI